MQVLNFFKQMNFFKRRQVFYNPEKKEKFNRDAHIINLSIKYIKTGQESTKSREEDVHHHTVKNKSRGDKLSVESLDLQYANSFDNPMQFSNSGSSSFPSDKMNSSEEKELEAKIEAKRRDYLKAQTFKASNSNVPALKLQSDNKELPIVDDNFTMMNRENLILSKSMVNSMSQISVLPNSDSKKKSSEVAESNFSGSEVMAESLMSKLTNKKKDQRMEVDKRLSASLIHTVIITTILILTGFPIIETDFIEVFVIPESKIMTRERYCSKIIYKAMIDAHDDERYFQNFEIFLDSCINPDLNDVEEYVKQIGYFNFESSAVAVAFNKKFNYFETLLEVITEDYENIVNTWRPDREFYTVAEKFDDLNTVIYSYKQKGISQLESGLAMIQALVVSVVFLVLYFELNRKIMSNLVVPLKELIDKLFLYLNYEELTLIGNFEDRSVLDEAQEIEIAMKKFISMLSATIGQSGY